MKILIERYYFRRKYTPKLKRISENPNKLEERENK